MCVCVLYTGDHLEWHGCDRAYCQQGEVHYEVYATEIIPNLISFISVNTDHHCARPSLSSTLYSFFTQVSCTEPTHLISLLRSSYPTPLESETPLFTLIPHNIVVCYSVPSCTAHLASLPQSEWPPVGRLSLLPLPPLALVWVSSSESEYW